MTYENATYSGADGMEVHLLIWNKGKVYDPTGATVREITIVRPDGTKLVERDAVAVGQFDPDNDDLRPCLVYKTTAADIEQAGTYAVVGWIEDASGKWPAHPTYFTIHRAVR